MDDEGGGGADAPMEWSVVSRRTCRAGSSTSSSSQATQGTVTAAAEGAAATTLATTNTMTRPGPSTDSRDRPAPSRTGDKHTPHGRGKSLSKGGESSKGKSKHPVTRGRGFVPPPPAPNAQTVFLCALISVENGHPDREELAKALTLATPEEHTVQVVRQLRGWQVEFSNREALEAFLLLKKITVGVRDFPIIRYAEKGKTTRLVWVRASRLVRVHWLPSFIPDSYIISVLQPCVKVVSVTMERSISDGYGNGVRRFRVEGENADSLPHMSSIVYEGERWGCLITVAGRAPMCLKCKTVGHIRGDCPSNGPKVGSYASRLAGGAMSVPLIEPEVDPAEAAVSPAPPSPSVPASERVCGPQPGSSRSGSGLLILASASSTAPSPTPPPSPSSSRSHRVAPPPPPSPRPRSSQSVVFSMVPPPPPPPFAFPPLPPPAGIPFSQVSKVADSLPSSLEVADVTDEGTEMEEEEMTVSPRSQRRGARSKRRSRGEEASPSPTPSPCPTPPRVAKTKKGIAPSGLPQTTPTRGSYPPPAHSPRPNPAVRATFKCLMAYCSSRSSPRQRRRKSRGLNLPPRQVTTKW